MRENPPLFERLSGVEGFDGVKDYKGKMNVSVMETHELTDTITLIKGENRGRFPFSHSFLIKDDVTALIDTGCGIETLNQLKEKEKIDVVINSHSHPDHSAGNWLFPGVPLKVPKEEIEFNSDVEKLSVRYTNAEIAGVWRDFVSQVMGFKDAHPTECFGDGDVLDFGSTRLVAVHAPGHTIGHHCFFERSEKILFSFDIDFTRFGPWYGHRESDIEEFRRSIEKVKALKPEMVVSSHKEVVTEEVEVEFEKFVNIFRERDETILKFLEKEKTFGEMVDAALIYRDFSFHPVLLRYWEEMMIRKHLKGLVERGLVAKMGELFLNVSVR